MVALTKDVPAEANSTKFHPLECYKEQPSCLLGPGWIKIYEHACDFDGEGFFEVIHYLVRNPNISSSVLFRADILYDSDGMENIDVALQNQTPDQIRSKCPVVETGLPKNSIKREIVRRFVPRNDGLDKAINQSVFYYTEDTHTVVMIPHVEQEDQLPFYHPRVAGLAFIHTGHTISVAYRPFPKTTVAAEGTASFDNRQLRTALHLLKTVWKHGHGNLAGYKKRMHHDQIIPQKRVQDRFSDLKKKHAARLISDWAESTDPAKQVFEQIGVAAFLIELWRDMYSNDSNSKKPPFPGFVDIGCGNGVLTEILISEGFSGWGIEGHKRKTWPTLSVKTQKALVHGIVVPAPLDWIAGPDSIPTDFGISTNPVPDNIQDITLGVKALKMLSSKLLTSMKRKDSGLPPVHNGIFNLFPESVEGPFIVSNHADELTGWTPFLAMLNRSSFFIVPCCSRNLSGERFRAPSHGNNWTADASAPRYFGEQKLDKQGKRQKHIAIQIPTSVVSTKVGDDMKTVEETGQSSFAQDNNSHSRSSSMVSTHSFHVDTMELERKYHFVNSAPLVQTSVATRNSTSKSESSNQGNGQAAETGDLKSLSQKARSKTLSGYQALCCWIVYLADQCGYLVEREMLRVPSTRNFGIVGRFTKAQLNFEGDVEMPFLDNAATLRQRIEYVLNIIAAEGGASRAKWVGVCEKEVVKSNDISEHGV